MKEYQDKKLAILASKKEDKISIKPEMLELLNNFGSRRYQRPISQAKAARSLANLKIGAKTRKQKKQERMEKIAEAAAQLEESKSQIN